MLYAFHGSNTQDALKKATALIGSLRVKRPDASYVRVEAGQWTPSIIEEHLGGQGLFSNKYIIFLDRISENEEAKEALPGFIPAMNESANIFIVLEGTLSAEMKKEFEKGAEKVIGCEVRKSESPKVGKRDDFNIFALADALGSRDSLKAWSLYRRAIDNGTESENIVGTLFWQVKSMILSAQTKNAAEAGVSPFVFSKAKKHAGNYSAEELGTLAEELISVYHDGHRGKVDMELGVERILLQLT